MTNVSLSSSAANISTRPTTSNLISQIISTTPGLEASSITSSNDVCKVERNWYTLGFQAIVLPSIFFNAATLVAALIDRKKLQRENCFFASVISTIVSNNVYLFMLEWILFDNYWDPATVPKAAGLTFDKMLWVFLEAFTIALPFLICGNIVCLTYVTVHSASYVGRVARVEDSNAATKRFQRMRRVTSGLLVTSWMVPFLLTVLAMAAMNCAKHCVCPTTNYAGDLCPGQNVCSRFWAPVTKNYLWLNVGLWTAATLVMCALLWRSISQYQRTTRRASMSLPAATDSALSCDMVERPRNSTTSSYVVTTKDNYDVTAKCVEEQNTSKQNENNNAANDSTSQLRKKKPLTRQNTKLSFRDRLNPRLYFALILSAIYIACSTCFVAAIIIDSLFDPTGVYAYLLFALSRITMWVYTTACPIIMVKNLPQLKISLYRLYTSVTSCHSRHSPKRHVLAK